MTRGAWTLATVVAVAAPQALIGQSATPSGGQDQLGATIAAASDARVAFHFDVDADVTVCEHGFYRTEGDGRQVWGRWDASAACPGGPLEVVVHRQGARVDALEFGPVGFADADRDLGRVDAAEAAHWLVSVHDAGADADVAGEAIGAAVVALGDPPVEPILALARDRRRPSELRRSALFWSAQLAAAGIDHTLAGIAADEAEDQEVRDAAIFALSRRPEGEYVPVLMDLARTAPHARTRKTALFWLSQADDARVPDFFAELILGSGGG